ncbi:sigma-70 family RNA polymerase sigma factor [Lacihabitans sp. CCS-44]|uniref:RNA polymerase sigma factor n=1 Tax=Lacihabitans sp. CCS-44 TaxID=2487331 RepID=UPI0020CC6FDD|nr:sigma-70 family RNA polymerase sigma factor [Lacihabitans sp. CCS-44]MCP9756046.1 sigma-70 family RNA polymerase sigma factor [Lacihabitans sp. CCS-44]
MEKEFTGLIDQHKGIIYKVCHLYCHESEDRKDLFQEIVIQLWKAYPNFRNESKLSTWIYKIALNTALTSLRKEGKNKPNKSISEADFEIPAMESIENEHVNILYQAIQQLTEIEKAIIMLYLDEKNYDEITDIVGTSKTNVGVKLNRIKQKLGKIIKTN